MRMTINTNGVCINAQRNLSLSGTALAVSMQRLSSGLRVNSAKDDAAVLAISERMSAQVRGLQVAARNANDGISLAQTAEGALSKVGDMLQRMRELAMQSSNATNSAQDRKALQAEVSQLRSEIDRVAKSTTFNGKAILDGSFSGGVFQIGAEAGGTVSMATIANAKSAKLGKLDYAATTLTVNAADVTDLSAIRAGVLQLVTQGRTINLGAMGKASSVQERMAQIVTAINAQTADTKMIAYLQNNASESFDIVLRSEGVEAVTVNGQKTVQAIAIGFQGFELTQTGLQGLSLAGPVGGSGYDSYVQALEQLRTTHALTSVTLPSAGANGYTESVATSAWNMVKAAYEAKYLTYSPVIADFGISLSRTSSGTISWTSVTPAPMPSVAGIKAVMSSFGVWDSSWESTTYSGYFNAGDVLPAADALVAALQPAALGTLQNPDSVLQLYTLGPLCPQSLA